MKPTRPAWLTVEIAALAIAAVAGVLLVGGIHPAPADSVLAAYSTDLSTRTPHQQYNARRAAAAVDGVVVPPGGVFSFDDTLHGWTADQGFLKAPVSYDGTLIDDYGGGVCEASTTLYNAALLAGLPILERHQHSFSPSYAPPGRDAAVAYPSADLRFRNSYPWPITLHLRPWGSRLIGSIQALHAPLYSITLESRILGRTAPVNGRVLPGSGLHRSRWRIRGRDGLRVAIIRYWYQGNTLIRTEQVSDNTYLPISRVDWQAN